MIQATRAVALAGLMAALPITTGAAEDMKAGTLVDAVETAAARAVAHAVPELEGARLAVKVGIPRSLIVATPREKDVLYFIVGDNELKQSRRLKPGLYKAERKEGRVHVTLDGAPLDFAAVPPGERLVPLIGNFDVEWMCEKAPELIHDFCTTFVWCATADLFC